MRKRTGPKTVMLVMILKQMTAVENCKQHYQLFSHTNTHQWTIETTTVSEKGECHAFNKIMCTALIQLVAKTNDKID